MISILSNHCINEAAVDHLLNNNYFNFISERKKAITEQLKTNCHVRNILEPTVEEMEEALSEID